MVEEKRNKRRWLIRLKDKSPLLFLPVILAIGGLLRLWRIEDFMTFLGDEGRDALAVEGIIVHHDLVFLGPTASVGGFFLGPFYYYLMVPFLWLFNFNPVGPSVMVALFGTATIFLTYLLGKKIFNERTGLIAALLYALSPVVINYSRSSWNPNIVPFFALLLIYSVLNLYESKRTRNLVFTGLLLGIGIQLHYLFTFLFVFTFLHLFFLRKGLKKKDLALFIGAILLPLLPFILFEIKHGFLNTRLILEFIFGSKDTGFSFSVFVVNITDVYRRLFVRLVTNNYNFIGTLLGVFSLLVIILQRRIFVKTSLVIFLTWLAVPLLMFGLYKKDIYDYYLGIIFPVPFLLTGYLLSSFWKNKIGLFISLIALAFVVKINWDGRPFLVIPNRQLNQAKIISEFVLEKTGGKPFNFALITGQNSDHAYRYFFEINRNLPITIQNKEVDSERNTVTGQLLVVCEIECQPLGNSLWEVAGFGRAEIAGVWNVSVVKVYKLVPFGGR